MFVAGRVPQNLGRTAGMVMQTLDVLDLAVLHLSTFERSHKRYQVGSSNSMGS
jgi:hypothetical protein